MTKLKFMPYAQAHVAVTSNGATLVSYKTPVASIRDGWLTINGLYSMTTRKHLSAFCREYVNESMTFDSIKYLANNPVMMNIHTGEIVDLM